MISVVVLLLCGVCLAQVTGFDVRAAMDEGRQLPVQLCDLNLAVYDFTWAVGHCGDDLILVFIKYGARVDHRSHDSAFCYGCTPLHAAAMTGKLEIASLLIQHGAFVDADSYEINYTPLHYAAQNGHDDVASLLLSHGASVDARSSNGSTPFLCAIAKGITSTAWFLVEKGADPHAVTYEGQDAVHIAARGCQESMVLNLFSKNMDINSADKNGYTPLHWAVSEGCTSTVSLLLDEGANVNAKTSSSGVDKDNIDGIGTTQQYGYDTTQQYGYQTTDMYWHWQFGYDTTQQYGYDTTESPYETSTTIENGTSSFSGSFYGATPLHIAAARGFTAIVSLLLYKGADVAAKDAKGTTALFLAVQGDHEAVVQLLNAHGVDVLSADENGKTLLHLAAEMGKEALVKYLLEKGAAIDANCTDGTPLHLAVGSKRFQVVSILLKSGASMEARNSLDQTPLHLAARSRADIEAGLLIRMGANVNAQTIDCDYYYQGWTPLHFAARADDLATAAMLLQAGANVYAYSYQGYRPESVAGSSTMGNLLSNYYYYNGK